MNFPQDVISDLEIDDPAIDRGVDALLGHHPERGGQERRQAVFSVARAIFNVR